MFSQFENVKLGDTIHYKAKNDGTTSYIKLIENRADKGLNKEVYLGVFGIDGVQILGFNYNLPKITNLNLRLGVKNYWVDGSLFLYSWKKKGIVKQSLKTKSAVIHGQMGTVKYVAKMPVEKRRSLGIHFGASQFKFQDKVSTSGLSGYSLFGGVTLFRAMHLKTKILDRNVFRKGTHINKLNLDFVTYPNTTVKSAVRLYFDGKASFWSESGKWSLHYMFGISTVNVEDSSAKIGVPFGLGIGFNFK